MADNNEPKRKNYCYSQQEWQERLNKFQDYLVDNPNVTARDVRYSGHFGTLLHFYRSRLNEAKREAGIGDEFIRIHTFHWSMTSG